MVITRHVIPGHVTPGLVTTGHVTPRSVTLETVTSHHRLDHHRLDRHRESMEALIRRGQMMHGMVGNRCILLLGGQGMMEEVVGK